MDLSRIASIARVSMDFYGRTTLPPVRPRRPVAALLAKRAAMEGKGL